jgi:ketosteroid isomerase-like protein
LLFVVAAVVAPLFGKAAGRSSAEEDRGKSIDTFNQEFVSACQRMDHQAAAALWADDGVDLLPGIPPMVGKAKTAEWLNGLTPHLAVAKMIYCTVARKGNPHSR